MISRFFLPFSGALRRSAKALLRKTVSACNLRHLCPIVAGLQWRFQGRTWQPYTAKAQAPQDFRLLRGTGKQYLGVMAASMLLVSCADNNAGGTSDNQDSSAVNHSARPDTVITPQTPVPNAVMTAFSTPAPTGSCCGNVYTSPDSLVYLTYMFEDKMWFSVLDGVKWSEPKAIKGKKQVTNWADFGGISTLDNNTLLSHYLEFTNKDDFTYDVALTTSADKGKTWSKPFSPHSDNTQTEHGFVSVKPFQNKWAVAWLDGRQYASDNNQMELHFAFTDASGNISEEALLDPKVCDCCQTDMAVTENDIYVVYRDRSDQEMRDISIVRYQNGAWSTPAKVATDNWKITGCPVNGPAISAKGEKVAVTWYTEGRDSASVFTAFSMDGGKTFGEPVRINKESTRGRVDVAWIDNDNVIVIFDRIWRRGLNVSGRVINQDGSMGNIFNIANLTEATKGGFARITPAKNNYWLVTYTLDSDPGVQRNARIQFAPPVKQHANE